MAALHQTRDLRARRRQLAFDDLRESLVKARTLISEGVDALLTGLDRYERTISDDPFSGELSNATAPIGGAGDVIDAVTATAEVFGGTVTPRTLRAGARNGVYPSIRIPSIEGSRDRLAFSRRELLDYLSAQRTRAGSQD